jgi:hypothetical protein
MPIMTDVAVQPGGGIGSRLYPGMVNHSIRVP